MRKPGADRQRDHRQRMRERGFVQITVMVPNEKLDTLKRLAARLRAKHEAESSDD